MGHGASSQSEAHDIPRRSGPIGQHNDPRFTLHQRQPRADKLDAAQRRLCHADTAFLEALRTRVASPARFAAFLDGVAFYVALERPCERCGDYRRRTRDRACYGCHLNRGGENFERMKAGLRPHAMRSRDSHLDLLERKKAERNGQFSERVFDGLTARRWPTGRLEVVFPNGIHEPDMSKLDRHGMNLALNDFPQLAHALEWAGWTVPGF